eukprot:1678896-Rhodomonas_salina.2
MMGRRAGRPTRRAIVDVTVTLFKVQLLPKLEDFKLSFSALADAIKSIPAHPFLTPRALGAYYPGSNSITESPRY